MAETGVSSTTIASHANGAGGTRILSPWYVCRTKPRQENLAARKLMEQGYEAYLPMLARWEGKKGAWHRTEEVMFPRYGFVRCVRLGQSIAPIRSTPGVSDLVRFGAAPATLGEAVVDAIRVIAEQRANSLLGQATPFSVGENVVVADGPLKRLAGIVSEIGRERVVVMLTLLGREKPVSISANDLALA